MRVEVLTMRSALHIKTTILPGHRIEISIPELPVGETVEVHIMPKLSSLAHRSAIEVLEETPGQRLFKTSAEADRYLQEERDSWER